MRATIMFGAGDVRIDDVPDAGLVEPTDAVVRVTRACICGSDLWPYATLEPTDTGLRVGHEAVGADVRNVKVGDVVVMPFAYSDGTCDFCRDGLHTSCMHGGFFGSGDVDGAQAEALRTPHADGTLFVLPVGETMPASQPAFFANVTVSGGPAPVRAYIEELLPDVLEGRIEPGRVFDRTVPLGGVPDGYRAMADREAIKVMVRP